MFRKLWCSSGSSGTQGPAAHSWSGTLQPALSETESACLQASFTEMLKKGALEERSIEIDATPPRQTLNMEGSPQGMQVQAEPKSSKLWSSCSKVLTCLLQLQSRQMLPAYVHSCLAVRCLGKLS